LAFGFSRPTYYQAQYDFEREGLPGLLARKRGPHGGHKLTGEIMEEIRSACMEDPSVQIQDLIDHVEERFGVTVHRRTLERALARVKKKPR
jgi:transposase